MTQQPKWCVGRSDSLSSFALFEPEEPPATAITVAIDIKPGKNDNPTTVNINPAKDKDVSVAILTTDDFDASIVDWTSVRFGKNWTRGVAFRIESER